MSEVFLCRKGQLNNPARRDLRAAGIVVVEVDDPDSCQFIRSSALVSGDEMLWAALEALNVEGSYGSKGDLQRERLAGLLLKIVRDQRKAKEGS